MHVKRRIFVFGSNLAGRHGKGAALDARKLHGAVYGVGEGLTGNAYAVPTKGHPIAKYLPAIVMPVLPLAVIAKHVATFLRFAADHPEMEFEVTRFGCGHAGYTDHDIAPLLAGATHNCVLPPDWREILRDTALEQRQPAHPLAST